MEPEINIKNSVLIVDEEEADLIELTQILNKDYTVYAAKNGKDAVETAKVCLPDIILMDILMPEMDGYEVIRNLRDNEETRTIPIIIISGLSNSAEEEKGLTLGACDYIAKPFRPSIIKLRVQNHILLSKQLNMVKTLSLTDALTVMFNRRGFDSRLQQEWNRAKRDKTALALFIADIDNFKNYNDTYGHLQGDEALKAIAKVFETTLKRAVDFSARWGGEEFAALLPSTNFQGALNIAEELRKNIEKTEIKLIDVCVSENTNVTVSVGLNIFFPKKKIQSGIPLGNSIINTSIQDFVNGADIALYTAKKNGKNRVCVFEN